MVYQISKFLTYVFLRVFFKRIHISGRENIPKDTPVIFASNHPNSFLDAIIIGTYLLKPIYTLVRGDVFSTSKARYWLAKWNLYPVYRLQEGKENLSKNDLTTEQCIRILRGNRQLLIFAEGLCVIEKKLRPIKKGTARIAFAAQQVIDKDMYIVPTSVNYTFPLKARKEVMIHYGKPIRVRDYQLKYCEQPARAVNEVTDAIKQGIEQYIITVNKNVEETTELLFQINRNSKINLTLPFLCTNNKRLKEEMTIANSVNNLASANPIQFSKLEKQGKLYRKELKISGISDQFLGSSGFKKTLLICLFPVLFPIALIGMLLNFWPYLAAKWVANKYVKSDVFYASVLFPMWMVFFILHLSFDAIVFPWFFGAYGLWFFLFILVSGFCSFLFLENLSILTSFVSSFSVDNVTLTKLKKERNEILKKTNSSPC